MTNEWVKCVNREEKKTQHKNWRINSYFRIVVSIEFLLCSLALPFKRRCVKNWIHSFRSKFTFFHRIEIIICHCLAIDFCAKHCQTEDQNKCDFMRIKLHSRLTGYNCVAAVDCNAALCSVLLFCFFFFGRKISIFIINDFVCETRMISVLRVCSLQPTAVIDY